LIRTTNDGELSKFSGTLNYLRLPFHWLEYRSVEAAPVSWVANEREKERERES
jgi:hypothetical protein